MECLISTHVNNFLIQKAEALLDTNCSTTCMLICYNVTEKYNQGRGMRCIYTPVPK
eukprot:c48998_g1_i1 orf=24-191(+)